MSGKYDVNKYKGQSILSEDFEDSSSIIYRPKTIETRQNYEIILSFIQESLGDQPRDILCGAADEVLITLKNDKLRDKERKRDIEALLGALPDERFSILVNLGKKITDWSYDQAEKLRQGGGGADEEEIDENMGVKVMIGDEDEEEEEDNDLYEVNEAQEDEEEEGQDAGEHQTIQGNISTEEMLSNSNKPKPLLAHQIDAFWLQRKLSKVYDDPTQAQTKVKEVIDILKEAVDERDVENQLVLLLGFNQFDLVKLLRSNRNLILYCTLLASAQSADEKRKIEEKMRNDPQLAGILQALEIEKPKEEERNKIKVKINKREKEAEEQMDTTEEIGPSNEAKLVSKVD